MGKLYVVGPRDGFWKTDPRVVNTTSHSTDFGRELSPFMLGPIKLWNGLYSQNMENAWQYSKVYQCHIDEKGMPNQKWYDWSRCGFDKVDADRYPMGKGAKPLYSFWNGEKLDKWEARIKIYIPLYANAVVHTNAFVVLQNMLKIQDVYLWDFDGYDKDKKNMSFWDVIYGDNSVGHAFVIAMLLEGFMFYNGKDYVLPNNGPQKSKRLREVQATLF